MTQQTRSADRLRDRIGSELFERIEHLDRVRVARRPDAIMPTPHRGDPPDVDVVLAGGGLSLLVAAELARLGLRVVVVERTRAGVAHREWNASESELAPLVRSAIVSTDALNDLVVAKYREGICRFHGGTSKRVTGVLDHAIDAGPLLARVRAVAQSRGVQFVDGGTVDSLGIGADAVRVGWTETGGARRDLLARVFVDGRGAGSPYATADLVCPTVGGVLRGLREGSGEREFDPHVGEILVTTEDADASTGRQHVWEGFPGRPSEITVYLFYYARAHDAVGPALAHLYERFFDTLATYKEGDAALVRPTFGYIPGWSRLTPAPRAPSRRVVLVGDAAARHSPLTFCGFGAMLRSFQPVARSIADAIGNGVAPPLNVVPEDAVHALTGALARVMASGTMHGPRLNRLLDTAFGVLENMGNEAFSNLLKDRMSGRNFIHFLQRTGSLHPAVYGDVLRALGPLAAAKWGLGLAREVRA